MARVGSATLDVKEDILKNRLYFPSFRELPNENDLDVRYWKADHRTGNWLYACTWCFLAEITNDDSSQISFVQNNVLVRDRSGHDNIPIFFYPKSGHFDFDTLKKGHTVCVLQAQQHYFFDCSIGLRIESLQTIKVIPCALDDLFTLSTYYFERKDTCWGCGERAKITENTEQAAIGVELKRCAACRIAQYCCKDCQVKDWKERHRRWCRVVMPEFLKLMKIDYHAYNEHALFGFFPFYRKW